MRPVLLPSPDRKGYSAENEAQTRRTLEQAFRESASETAALSAALPIFVGTAGEALSEGAMVSIQADGEILLADSSTNNKLCDGFVRTNYVNGATNVRVYASGENAAVAATPGASYYLSTEGGVTTTPPGNASPVIVQQVGRGSPSGTLLVTLHQAIERP